MPSHGCPSTTYEPNCTILKKRDAICRLVYVAYSYSWAQKEMPQKEMQSVGSCMSLACVKDSITLHLLKAANCLLGVSLCVSCNQCTPIDSILRRQLIKHLVRDAITLHLLKAANYFLGVTFLCISCNNQCTPREHLERSTHQALVTHLKQHYTWHTCPLEHCPAHNPCLAIASSICFP